MRIKPISGVRFTAQTHQRGGFKATARQSLTVTDKDYWSITETDLFSTLETGPSGISEQEAQSRLKTYGYNELPRKGLSWTTVLLRQLKNPIFAILVASAVVAGFFGEAEQSIAILSMIAISVALGYFNEYKAEKIVEDLTQRVSLKALVTRDGKTYEINSRLLVPGDLATVYIGDIVPADIRITESKDLQADEATLTGESFPVDKAPGRIDAPHPTPQQMTNYMFMGTVIAHGSGRGIVVETGNRTEFGSITKSLTRPHPETEFQKGIKNYGSMLLTLTGALAVGIFALNALVGRPLIDALLFSLAVAIGLVPELMPAIVTISLSQGAGKMAKRQVIVKRLVSIEDFGTMNVLCTDKTGTLTEGKITLKDYLSLNEEKDPKVLTYSLLCNDAVTDGRIAGNPMDVAIWEYAMENGFQDSAKPFTKMDEVPFDYQRRLMSVAVRRDGAHTFITKGAPESVIPRCAYADVVGKIEPISSVLKPIEAKLSEFSGAGYRVLAVAFRSIETKPTYSVDDESDLTLIGFLVFSDPPKEDAAQAIFTLKEMGVNVKILTGDNELVAKRICEELEVPVKGTVVGSELSQMNPTELQSAVDDATIFARVTPEQKLNIIKALKANGLVVGFLGDGVNDAPSLYEADVGISVDSAVDVSKEAADIVLLEKDLGVLANGILEGRKIFDNTLKYILMGTSSNFGNMFSAAAASVFLPFLPMLPMQILFMNLLYDVANMTLPTDNVDDEYIRAPRRWDIGFIRKYTLFFGPFSSLYDFLTYGIMLFIFAATPALFQSGWFVESFWTEVFVIFVIRTRRIPFFSSRPGKWLSILTVSCIAVGTIVPFTVLGEFLGFVPLPSNYWVLLILMVVTYLLLVDAGKVFFYKVCKCMW